MPAQTVYVIGLQEHGGAWVSNEIYFTNEKIAYATCDSLRAESTCNGKYAPIAYKVFHLYLSILERKNSIE